MIVTSEVASQLIRVGADIDRFGESGDLDACAPRSVANRDGGNDLKGQVGVDNALPSGLEVNLTLVIIWRAQRSRITTLVDFTTIGGDGRAMNLNGRCRANRSF